MKKLFFALALLFGSTVIFAGTPPEVNQKVLKIFNETFKDPKEVNWHEYDNYYEVSFKQDEIKMQVKYDNEGNVVGTMRFYYEKELPPYILSKIRVKYPNRSVYMITEIFSETDLQYYVTMEDDKHWYTVVSNPIGELQQTGKFKKAPVK